MNPLSSLYHDEKTHMAARELSSFIAAVSQQYGPQQARLSAEDWLEELDHMEGTSPCDNRNWRAVTIAASARLADRLSASAGAHEVPLYLVNRYEAASNTNA
ncbi:hypothetical protein Acid345_2441 [Candidatus Koribacter versatilis Ellin345]|uniref:Uncharacterized protein n=1 Tax=Koribacter versatilis (strain Ellin345) TaxID=204669 RepID=Q1INV8_KORVE|nr:hypothetical protein [Candidatus Koribacter versatilis]ABF41442.1 hypothetical protein Acid345_2441 [Candidatus Koribacter versatilis Ellin345]